MVSCNIQVSYWGGGDKWQWIDYLYFLSFIKLGISVVKSLSEARAQGFGGWTGILGNPVKFGLGLISVFFESFSLYSTMPETSVL